MNPVAANGNCLSHQVLTLFQLYMMIGYCFVPFIVSLKTWTGKRDAEGQV